MREFIEQLFTDPSMLRMGHRQRAEDLNLGMGWLYYALARLYRPEKTVVIGSYRGFTPAIMAKSMSDNSEGGEVIFIDPSLVDEFWRDPQRVDEHFKQLGTPNVRHFLHTTQEFVDTSDYAELDNIGLLMIDGLHTAEQARFDYLAFLDKLSKKAVVLFHDSIGNKSSRMYGAEGSYEYSVSRFMDRLRMTPGLQVFDIPFKMGLSMVQGHPETLEHINADFE